MKGVIRKASAISLAVTAATVGALSIGATSASALPKSCTARETQAIDYWSGQYDMYSAQVVWDLDAGADPSADQAAADYAGDRLLDFSC